MRYPTKFSIARSYKAALIGFTLGLLLGVFKNDPVGIFLAPVLGTALFGVACLLLHWIWEYPHRGWRRLAAIAGPGIGFAASCYIMEEDSNLLVRVVIIIGTAIATGIVLVLCREIYLRIKEGFNRPTADG